MKAEINDRYGDRHRELLVQPARDAGDEDRGDEDRRQDQRDGHDRARDLLHGLDGRLLRGQALLDMALHRLDHDDGVIDDQADGEDQAEKG